MKHRTFDELVARTAAQKAAGTLPTFPEHRGKAKTVERTAAAVPKPKPPAQQNEPCIHRSKERIRSERCGPCGGKVELFVFPCAVFGECTIAKPLKGVAGCCKGCVKYEAGG